MYDFYIFVGTKNIITSLLLTLFGLWESYIYIYISVYVYNKTILKIAEIRDVSDAVTFLDNYEGSYGSRVCYNTADY